MALGIKMLRVTGNIIIMMSNYTQTWNLVAEKP